MNGAKPGAARHWDMHLKSRRPTIDDVAARAGVARATVSRVLNNGPNVRQEVRDKVQLAVSELGYKVNVQARHLASGSSRQIALIHATDTEAEPNSYYHSGLELGAMRGCAERGYSLVTYTANPEAAGERERILEMARGRNFDGLILTPPFADDLKLIRSIRQAGCPLVCISAGPEAQRLVPWVGIDDAAAGEAIGSFLVRLGHRRFAYVDGPADHVSAGLRRKGFLAALAREGIGPDAVSIYRGNFTFRSGVEIGQQILCAPDRPSALVCANDDMAAGALLAAHKLALRIPADISITGFDDTPVSEIVWPPLTTVHQPIRLLGARAVERLVDVIEKNGAGDRSSGNCVPFRVVDRMSTAPVEERLPG